MNDGLFIASIISTLFCVAVLLIDVYRAGFVKGADAVKDLGHEEVIRRFKNKWRITI